jgi:hypothetical protein
VAKPREDLSHPSEEDRWQRSRELVNSEVREVGVQKLDTPSREWRGYERIRAVHPRRTGGRDPGSRELGGSWVEARIGRSKSRVAKTREDQSRPSEEDRWQRSRDLANSGVRRVNAQVVGVKSREA